jgi:hypothetical protein
MTQSLLIYLSSNFLATCALLAVIIIKKLNLMCTLSLLTDVCFKCGVCYLKLTFYCFSSSYILLRMLVWWNILSIHWIENNVDYCYIPYFLLIYYIKSLFFVVCEKNTSYSLLLKIWSVAVYATLKAFLLSCSWWKFISKFESATV